MVKDLFSDRRRLGSTAMSPSNAAMTSSTANSSARASSSSLKGVNATDVRRSKNGVGAAATVNNMSKFRGFSADRARLFGDRRRGRPQSASSSATASSSGTGPLPPISGTSEVNPGEANGDGDSVYQRLVRQQEEGEEQYRRDVALGKRIGWYRFKSDIGTGNFSKVKLATNLLTKDRVAVKLIDKTKLDSKTQKMLQREIHIMDSLSHPSLIRLYEVSETATGLQLIMEFAPGGELFARLTEEGYYDEDKAKVIFAQVASAISYMHDNYFIHRDLKAENVFFSTPDVVKVGDFGFATEVSRIDQHLNTFCGSPPYAAPELFQDDHYVGPSVDIWALGILLYFMVTGGMPFKGSTVAALKASILEGNFDLPEFLSADCMEIIQGILRRKPAWRLTMQQIKESHFLSGISWPEPDYIYSPLPTKPHHILDPSDVPHFEAVVRKRMKGLGVTERMLNESIERGSKSPIIGAYRTLLHKEIQGTGPSSDIKRGTSGLDQSGRSDYSRMSTSASSAAKTTNLTPTPQPKQNGKKRSRLCNLL